VMPQALAYAALAGLQPQYGLYSAFMGCFVYTLLGSCKDITIGPTALLSLMTYQQVFERNFDYAILLCFLTGCVMILMAALRLGVLVEFISQPVTVGFTTATSLIIVASQLKGLLGISFSSGNFLETLRMVGEHIHETRPWDATMGISSICILLFLRKVKDMYTYDKLKPTKKELIISKALWLLSTSRNALVVLVCSTIAFVFYSNWQETPFVLTGKVKPGIPDFKLPPFGTVLGNRTVGFSEMLSDLGASVVLVPVIAVLGNVAIAKAFASGESVDATQELITLAGCNLLGSFFSSMPITGSFSRSAVNHASGVKTPMGGLYTGVMILLALGALTPYFFFIPKASLAAVIICAVIFMVEYEVIKPMWKASRKDLVPMTATLIACLFLGVEIGILLGTAINIGLLLFYAARPNIEIRKNQTANGIEYIEVIPSASIHFPGVEHLRTSLQTAAKSKLPVVVNCSFMQSTDFTTGKGISSVVKEYRSKRQALYFYLSPPDVKHTLSELCDNFINLSSEEKLNAALYEVRKNGCPEDVTQVVTEMRELKGVEGGGRGEVAEPLLTASTSAKVCKMAAA